MTIAPKSSNTDLKDNKVEATCNPEATSIDKRVGCRIRLRRRLLGYSQEKLALALGLSFQQVQKYEKGSNRVGASRLFDIAQILQVPINFFFDELLNPMYIDEDSLMSDFDSTSVHDVREVIEDGTHHNTTDQDVKNNIFDLMNSKETANLLKAYYNIHEPEVRQKLLHLIRAMGG